MRRRQPPPFATSLRSVARACVGTPDRSEHSRPFHTTRVSETSVFRPLGFLKAPWIAIGSVLLADRAIHILGAQEILQRLVLDSAIDGLFSGALRQKARASNI